MAVADGGALKTTAVLAPHFLCDRDPYLDLKTELWWTCEGWKVGLAHFFGGIWESRSRLWDLLALQELFLAQRLFSDWKQ